MHHVCSHTKKLLAEACKAVSTTQKKNYWQKPAKQLVQSSVNWGERGPPGASFVFRVRVAMREVVSTVSCTRNVVLDELSTP